MKDMTIFDRIVRNENSFTELFYGFLRFNNFRQAFLKLLDIDILNENVKHEDFDTQLTINKFGRPDLALKYDDIEILFEIKVYNTKLTGNQPEGYYNYLKTKSKAKIKGLILIIPLNYYDINNYKRRLEEIKNLNDSILTRIITWNEISSSITNAEFDKISSIFAEYSNFIFKWFQLRPISLNSLNISIMFDKKFPESIEKTKTIIRNLFYEFEKQGYDVIWSKEQGFSEYGFYFNSTTINKILFIGLWLEYWLQSGNPLCIGLKKIVDAGQLSQYEKGIEEANLSSWEECGNWYVTYYKTQTLGDDNCINIMSELTKKILKKTGINSKNDLISDNNI